MSDIPANPQTAIATQPTHGTSLTAIAPSQRPRATLRQANDELLACLTLVAPSGMTGQDRAGWVAVARQTLTGIPADLLTRGCEKARRTCKFASEIVPTILAEVEGEWTRRKRIWAEREAFERNRDAPRLEAPDQVDASEVSKLIAELKGKLAA